ncbi:hypothetical protein GALMADRAFT_259814 [Galerina marginata CBS 339.88]|uniref:TRIP4/RQT4 C2HC5-type zinc finger domain-containing protein n=1 Tax=Galerina marginata (strain CBS 339.88) TaxID=685588 RepID=A0A067S5Q5_GALM3|nr:hypothetical protein GALMADRAFT_259814 [Galerina marginata CBS 339.88]
MQYRPAWKQHSSLPSDRIKQPPNNVAKSKGKGKQQPPPEPPKSKDVRRLEKLLGGVQNATGQERDPNGGCFCLARTHELSSYIPICHSCGLILCSVNLPQYCCPFCDKILMTGTVRESLISQLETQLASTIIKEEEAKEKAIQDSQKAAGAFPTLSSAALSLSSPSPVPAASIPPPSKQTYKVLSLTSNKRVVVSSYTSTPVHSRPASRNEDVEEEPIRVPRPPPEPTHADRTPQPSRPWENLIHGAVTYKPRLRVDDDTTPKGPSRRRRGNKGKEKETSSGQNV